MRDALLPLASFLLAATTLASAQPATGTQPLTHEALFLMKRVGSPVVSPDGRWAVFSVTEPSYDEKKEVQDLWIVPVDGSAKARRLTGGKAGESGGAWSPDSRRIAFTAKRDDDEVAQVYLLDVAGGGEAQRLTASPLAARAPKWSPDGRWIAYQSERIGSWIGGGAPTGDGDSSVQLLSRGSSGEREQSEPLGRAGWGWFAAAGD